MTTHPRLLPRRGAARATTWWGKAWVRAVEETAYAERDLRSGRSLARSGQVGAISTEPGTFLAAVREGDEAWTVAGRLELLDDDARAAFVELVAAEAGRVAALVAGELPHTLVEHAEEAGVELLPYGGQIEVACTCEAWTEPCKHALAVLYQLAWLIDADPFTLLAVRGLPRDDLLARLADLHGSLPGSGAAGGPAGGGAGGPGEDDAVEQEALALGEDAAARAQRLVALMEDGLPLPEHLL